MLKVTFKEYDYLHPRKHDFCSNPVPYVIATTQRSGSTLLSDLLLQTGICGQPGEYLTSSFVQRNEDLLRIGSTCPINKNTKDYINYIYSRYHSKNGIFGQKITWDQIVKINHDLPVGFLRKRSLQNSFKYYFGKPKVIFLRRANLVSQGISKYLALKTNKWHSWDKHDESKEVAIKNDQIFSIISEIRTHNDGWLELLNSSKLPYINVFYEELCSSPLEVLKKVIEFIHEEKVYLLNSPKKMIKPVNSLVKSKLESDFIKSLHENLI